jgi:hypothetical protein
MEDPDRLPDGVPHAVVGLTAFYTMSSAAVFVLALTHQRFWLIAFGAFVIPMIIARLVQKAERDRDHIHPAR